MELKPFRGYRYNPELVGDASQCIAPPYDVIDTHLRQILCQQSPYNIAHVTKPLSDNNADPYAQAAQHLQSFIQKGALKQDPQDTIYVYAQDFDIQGQNFRRTGFIALGRLEPYGDNIRPHEHTLDGPKADRLNLTRATKSQIGQIFMLYDDPNDTVEHILTQACTGSQLLCHQDDDNVKHRLFALTDPQHIDTVVQALKNQTTFIADGHHRYETALNYFEETNNPNAAWQLMTFVNFRNPGLLVLPTHRLIKNLPDFAPSTLIGRMNELFDVAWLRYDDDVQKAQRLADMLEGMAQQTQLGEHVIGMYFNDGAFYLATLRDTAPIKKAAPDHSHAWQTLDVAILHKLVLEKLLAIDSAALAAQSHVEYIKDFGHARDDALDAVDRQDAQGLFFLNPTPPEQVQAVAHAGERMPQKSTFFHPKVFSGLVVRMI